MGGPGSQQYRERTRLDRVVPMRNRLRREGNYNKLMEWYTRRLNIGQSPLRIAFESAETLEAFERALRERKPAGIDTEAEIARMMEKVRGGTGTARFNVPEADAYIQTLMDLATREGDTAQNFVNTLERTLSEISADPRHGPERVRELVEFHVSKKATTNDRIIGFLARQNETVVNAIRAKLDTAVAEAVELHNSRAGPGNRISNEAARSAELVQNIMDDLIHGEARFEQIVERLDELLSELDAEAQKTVRTALNQFKSQNKNSVGLFNAWKADPQLRGLLASLLEAISAKDRRTRFKRWRRSTGGRLAIAAAAAIMVWWVSSWDMWKSAKPTKVDDKKVAREKQRKEADRLKQIRKPGEEAASKALDEIGKIQDSLKDEKFKKQKAPKSSFGRDLERLTDLQEDAQKEIDKIDADIKKTEGIEKGLGEELAADKQAATDAKKALDEKKGTLDEKVERASSLQSQIDEKIQGIKDGRSAFRSKSKEVDELEDDVKKLRKKLKKAKTNEDVEQIKAAINQKLRKAKDVKQVIFGKDGILPRMRQMEEDLKVLIPQFEGVSESAKADVKATRAEMQKDLKAVKTAQKAASSKAKGFEREAKNMGREVERFASPAGKDHTYVKSESWLNSNLTVRAGRDGVKQLVKLIKPRLEELGSGRYRDVKKDPAKLSIRIEKDDKKVLRLLKFLKSKAGGTVTVDDLGKVPGDWTVETLQQTVKLTQDMWK